MTKEPGRGMVSFLGCKQEDLGPGIRNDRANCFCYSIEATQGHPILSQEPCTFDLARSNNNRKRAFI